MAGLAFASAGLARAGLARGPSQRGRGAGRSGGRSACTCVAQAESDDQGNHPPPPQYKPAFDLEADQALDMQLESLKRNNEPYVDHGIEVLYRFADIDPFARSGYFGRNLDLGQFERFRRVLHTHEYRALLNHVRFEPLSTLRLGEHKVKKRYFVEGFRPGESGTFEWTLTQKIGGLKDGYWFTESLISDSDAQEL